MYQGAKTRPLPLRVVCGRENTPSLHSGESVDPIDLKAIKARLTKATPGPWEWCIWVRRHALQRRVGPKAFLVVLETQGDAEADYPCANDADRDLIQHAPTDLATLIAEVERLRAEVEAERSEAIDYLVEEAERIRKGESEPANRECALLDAARMLGCGEHRRKEGY